MRNLGPSCERDFNAVGITRASQIVELGTEAAFLKMLIGKRKGGRAIQSCNAAYLYAIYGAIHDLDWRDIPETKKNEFKEMTAQLRASRRWD